MQNPGGSSASANGVNVDGTIVVGSTGGNAFRWTPAGGMQTLGIPTGGGFPIARSVSADGSIIVGDYMLASNGASRAFLWTASTGIVDLGAYASSVGVYLTGRTLQSATGVSADGSAVVGFGSFNGDSRAWLVSGLSRPCYPNCDGSTGAPALNVQDFTCFLQRFATGNAYANCDGSTGTPVLNVQDFTCFLQKFAQGCP